MPRGGYQQYRLNHKKPAKPIPEKAVTIELDFFCNKDQLIFEDKWIKKGDDSLIPAKNTKNEVANIAVCVGRKADAYGAKVTIKLAGSKFWRFSNQYDAITTKEELSDLYGKLTYERDDAICLDPNDDPLDPKAEIIGYRQISFIVKENKGGRDGTTHEFNINLDLLQTSPNESDRLKWQWLPITIDPEIKNPPTGPIGP